MEAREGLLARVSTVDGATEIKEIAARLEAGTVWINGHGGIHPMVPFGGAKHSGYGLEFGVEGLKSVSVSPADQRLTLRATVSRTRSVNSKTLLPNGCG